MIKYFCIIFQLAQQLKLDGWIRASVSNVCSPTNNLMVKIILRAHMNANSNILVNHSMKATLEWLHRVRYLVFIDDITEYSNLWLAVACRGLTNCQSVCVCVRATRSSPDSCFEVCQTCTWVFSVLVSVSVFEPLRFWVNRLSLPPQERRALERKISEMEEELKVRARTHARTRATADGRLSFSHPVHQHQQTSESFLQFQILSSFSNSLLSVLPLFLLSVPLFY